MASEKIPYGKIYSMQTLSATIRERRRDLQLTQTKLAGLCGFGVRFISDLENGKATCEVGKVIQVLQQLGLEIQLTPRKWGNLK